MDLHIMSLVDAAAHVPEKPTYALRIFSWYDASRSIIYPLESPNYVCIAKSVFDDVEPWFAKSDDLLFTEQIADDILREFSEYKDRCDAFLVHCSKGKNRSPAVGVAFNEIFGFGHDIDDLKKKYRFGELSGANMHVYDTLMRIARAQRYF